MTATTDEYVFQRQVEALWRPDDVLVGISTLGNNRNVSAALETARSIGTCTFAMTGQTGGSMVEIAEDTLRIASRDTARIQEGISCVCDWVERSVCGVEIH